MTSLKSKKRIDEIRKSRIPKSSPENRLVRGARVLGRMWREDGPAPCGWEPVCECPTRSRFCIAKMKWAELRLELPDREEILKITSDYWILEVMTAPMFSATGLDIFLDIMGEKKLTVGPSGTDLATLERVTEIAPGKERDKARDIVCRMTGIFAQ